MLLAICGNDPPGVLFLDDLQWADEATIDFLTYLVRRLHGRPILILATWIGEDLPPGIGYATFLPRRSAMAWQVRYSVPA